MQPVSSRRPHRETSTRGWSPRCPGSTPSPEKALYSPSSVVGLVRPMHGEMTITGRIIAVFVGVLLFLVSVEIILNFYNPFISRVKYNSIILPKQEKYELKNVNIRGLDKNIVHTKNSLGFRGEEPPKDFPDYLTIIAVGGSATESSAQSDNKTWPYLLGSKLSDNFDRLWINNAGLDGHTTFSHLILFDDYLKHIKPNVILLLIGVNDAGRENPSDHDAEAIRKGLYLGSLEGFLKSLTNYSETLAVALNLYRAERAKRLGLVHQDLNLSALQDTGPLEAEIEREILDKHRRKFLAGYERRVEKLVKMAREAGVEPILLTQPTIVGEGVDDLTGADLGNVRVNFVERDVPGHTAWQILELYNEASRQIAKENGIFLIDLAYLMPKSSRYFYDYIHYTNAGASELAQIVYGKLCPHLADRYMAHVREECG